MKWTALLVLSLMACTPQQGPTGPQGPAGPQGAQGAAGAAGAPGAPGAAGAAGPAGVAGTQGLKGDTGAMGAMGAMGLQGMPGAAGMNGAPGTTGQDILQALSGSQLALPANSTTCVGVPDLSLSINLPADASLYVTTNGGVQCTQAGTNYALADIVIFVDGNATLGRRVVAANTGGVGQIVSNWSFGRSYDLSQGVHLIEVGACGPGDANAVTANIGGTALQMQAVLTAMVIKK